MTRLVSAVLLLAGLSAACRSLPPDEELRALYAESADAPGDPMDLRAHASVERERAERVRRVRELIATEGYDANGGRLYAAALLLDSDEPSDLDLARELALLEVEAGDERGLRVAAEAMDRAAMLRDDPQPYGTQFVFSPVTGKWGLYEVDARTTDTERVAMGVPPLAEAMRRVRILNGEEPSRP